jgi:hypothetical protein
MALFPTQGATFTICTSLPIATASWEARRNKPLEDMVLLSDIASRRIALQRKAATDKSLRRATFPVASRVYPDCIAQRLA